MRSPVADALELIEAFPDEPWLQICSAAIDRLVADLAYIGQYDPRWKGQHVNNAPNRQQLIEWAYDAWQAAREGL